MTWTAEARNSAEQELASIRATKAGVDSKNNFWAWDAKRRMVTRITPNGDRVESDILPDAWEVDADQERGIATLSDGGRVINIIEWNGLQKRSIHLLHQGSDVAWLRGSQIAVTPRTTGPCVEIWDTSTGEYLSGFGTCPDIKIPSSGAVAVRATLLRYDRAHREIVTFDAFRGDLITFSETGSVKRRSHTQNPRDAAIDAWLKQLDRDARLRGGVSYEQIRKYPSMAIAPDQSIWLGENTDDRGITAVRILQDGTVRRVRIDVQRCASKRFVAWKDDFVFYPDPSSPQTSCVAVRRRE
ncbi:MAG TPA: hypothetical protein VGA84_09355 [Thermoanaerobaculia bacterium]